MLSASPSWAGTEPLGTSAIAFAPLSISAAVMQLGASDVMEETPADDGTSATKETSDGSEEKLVPDTDGEHKTVATTLQTESDEPPAQHEQIELDSRTEETDSALPPSIRIPGLVDSPPVEREREGSTPQAGEGGTKEDGATENDDDDVVPL